MRATKGKTDTGVSPQKNRKNGQKQIYNQVLGLEGGRGASTGVKRKRGGKHNPKSRRTFPKKKKEKKIGQ